MISQGAENALAAYEAVGAPLPKFIGFADSGEYMQRMLKINADECVLPYIVVSNPPGVGGSALNFGLNLLMGKELKDDVYSVPEYNSIYLPSKVWYTCDNQEDYREMAGRWRLGVISYWLTIDEIAKDYSSRPTARTAVVGQRLVGGGCTADQASVATAPEGDDRRRLSEPLGSGAHQPRRQLI